MKTKTKKVVGVALITAIAVVVSLLLMTVDRSHISTGYSINFSLDDHNSTFEVVSLTKAHAEMVDSKMVNAQYSLLSNGVAAVFVLQDTEGQQYVSLPGAADSIGRVPQSFQGPIPWGKYTFVDARHVDITLSSQNPIKVTINYSNWDRFWSVLPWLFWDILCWVVLSAAIWAD